MTASKSLPLPMLLLVAAFAPGVGACSQARASDDNAERASVQRRMKAFIGQDIESWLGASRDLAQAAPVSAGRGWDATLDKNAIAEMKKHWAKARWAYERIEGAIAPMFPESDTATDARYDDFLLVIGPVGDPNAFDDAGVVGAHAIERILWADSAPPEVVAFEKGLPGYRPARFPATEPEAKGFKEQLAYRFVADVQKLNAEFKPLTLDLAFAFRGLIDLAAEQVEKVDRAATGQEESRYAESTLRDLRANREGCLFAYRIFRPWLLTKPSGKDMDRAVLNAFSRLETAYAGIPGDAMPRPPRTWSSVQTTPEDLNTPFGRLFTLVKRESDDKVSGSLRASLVLVAEALGLPEVVIR
jgi:iron uptake system component EfeO